MTFINSLKLFGSNWVKALKFILYYFVVWGICVALLLPVIFEFKDLIDVCFQTVSSSNSAIGVFGGTLGHDLYFLLQSTKLLIASCFLQNLSMAIYALIVVLFILPFLINIGKYTFNEMIYSYMASKNKQGFFSSLVRTLKRSIVFALCKSLYNIAFVAIVCAVLYGISLISSSVFVVYFLPLVLFLVLVLLYTANQLTILGWAPAMLVFDCNIFKAYKKGIKAVKRHVWATFVTAALYFAIFWAIMILLGLYSFVALLPIMAALLSIYDMVVFFTSQGMRFYINDTKILTPKKLEEVDNIHQTSFIL